MLQVLLPIHSTLPSIVKSKFLKRYYRVKSGSSIHISILFVSGELESVEAQLFAIKKSEIGRLGISSYNESANIG